MKKYFLIIAVFIIAATAANAQTGFGVKAGLNFNSMSDLKVGSMDDIETSIKGKTGFHVGVVYKLKLPLGLALQPELLYTQKNTTITSDVKNVKYDSRVGYLQLPVNLQWGLDLVLFRPYIQVSPYIGYAISKTSDLTKVNYKDFQYGVGCGVGLEIWKIQISGKYNWDLGKVGSFEFDNLKKEFELRKSRGFELSLAVIF